MWEDIEINPENIPTLKLGFHIGQIVLAFVLWCLEIAVFRADDSIVEGRCGWTFAVCFLSVPAWIYLAMAPRFPRTRKLAQPHAMATVDGLFVILWLSAFCTQASYNSADRCGTACGPSKAIVALGVFVCLLFCVTTFLSIWTVKYWQWNNRLPGYDNIKRSQNIDPDKAAFSTAPHDEEAYAPVHMDDHNDDSHRPAHSDYSDPYGAPSYVSTSYAGGSAVGSQVSSGYGGGRENPFQQDNPFDSDTEYHRPSPGPPAAGRYAAPTAQDELEDDHRPVQFPAANYDRITR